jgi:hypothetical protein
MRRTFEVTTLQPLLEWADASLETSVNHPTLPHAIIVLNASETNDSTEDWSSEYATERLLAANRGCIDSNKGNPVISELARGWRQRGKRINTIDDLIHCYYSSFKVMRIPHKMGGKYQLLHDQVHGLHGLIKASCQLSFNTKRQANMLAKSFEMETLFQFAFDHFAQTLVMPFNFIAVSIRNNPLPENFGDHILQLAIVVQAHNGNFTATWIFDHILVLVASSVLLDCVRNRKGKTISSVCCPCPRSCSTLSLSLHTSLQLIAFNPEKISWFISCVT